MTQYADTLARAEALTQVPGQGPTAEAVTLAGNGPALPGRRLVAYGFDGLRVGMALAATICAGSSRILAEGADSAGRVARFVAPVAVRSPGSGGKQVTPARLHSLSPSSGDVDHAGRRRSTPSRRSR